MMAKGCTTINAVLVIFINVLCCVNCVTASYEKLDPINDDYGRKVNAYIKTLQNKKSIGIPPRHSKISIQLRPLEFTKENENRISINTEVMLEWRDERLAYENIVFEMEGEQFKSIAVPNRYVWKPLLYFGDKGSLRKLERYDLLIHRNGMVRSAKRHLMQLRCTFDAYHYPNALYHCDTLAYIISFSSVRLVSHHKNAAKSIQPEQLHHMGLSLLSWRMSDSGKATALTIDNSPVGYHDALNVSFVFAAKSDKVFYMFLVPTILASIVVPISFLIPPRLREQRFYALLCAFACLLALMMEASSFFPASIASLPATLLFTVVVLFSTWCSVVWLVVEGVVIGGFAGRVIHNWGFKRAWNRVGRAMAVEFSVGDDGGEDGPSDTVSVATRVTLAVAVDGNDITDGTLPLDDDATIADPQDSDVYARICSTSMTPMDIVSSGRHGGGDTMRGPPQDVDDVTLICTGIDRALFVLCSLVHVIVLLKSYV